MDDEYKRCRYSITCQAQDLAVVHCLRALCQFAEKGLSHPQIAWGGSGEQSWREAGKQITLRFTDPSFREAFTQEATRLLPSGSWREVERNDQDPATRRRMK